jgi:hypothetical protein
VDVDDQRSRLRVRHMYAKDKYEKHAERGVSSAASVCVPHGESGRVCPI